MKKYSSDPNVLLAGSAFLSILAASKSQEFKSDFEAVLIQYGVQTIDPAGWYPRQMYLDFFKRITAHKTNVMSNMISTGIKALDTMRLPSELHRDNMEDVFHLLIEIYQLNQRNLPPEDTGYLVSRVGEQHIRIIDQSPYPHDVNYGYICGLIQRFGLPSMSLERTFLNLAHPDSDGAIYDVTWE